jgi:hypothetical protein
MDSPMLKMLKSQNPDKEYPSNICLKWFEDEETILLEELKKNKMSGLNEKWCKYIYFLLFHI